MKNTIKSFRLFIRPDERSEQIARDIRELNSKLSHPLVESDDGDLVIAIGAFIQARLDSYKICPQMTFLHFCSTLIMMKKLKLVKFMFLP